LISSLGALLPDKGCHVRKAAGELAAVIDRSFLLSGGAAAHAYAQTRGRIGRIILTP
jgi:NADPH2:quinone reductase